MSRVNPYRRCKEVTLVGEMFGKRTFTTFWKTAHQQYLITTGIIHGCTYEVTKTTVVEKKEDGNKAYVELRKEGWIKWEDYCKANNLMCLYYDLGSILY